MSSPVHSEVRGTCPPVEVWERVAAGLVTCEEEAALTGHAAGCDGCGAHLREAIGLFLGETTPEEQSVLASLPSSTPEGLREIAARLAGPARRTSTVWTPIRLWVAAGAVAVCVAGVVLYPWLVPPEPPMELLARAYTKQRVLELRIPGAAYGPVRVQRGTGLSGAAPAELLDGLARVRKHLDGSPSDPAWLHAQGRADVLSWRFADALRAFQAAADLGAGSAEFFTDYGIAYFERAEANDARDDYSAAYELFSKALVIEPRHRAALFNRAIAGAKLDLLESAIADWEALLKEETDEGWRAEAKAKLDEVRRQRSRLFSPPAAPPAEFRAEAEWEETLLTIPGPAGRVRLEDLAGRLRGQHGDVWLAEALRLPAGAGWRAAVDGLSRLANIRAQARTDLYEATKPLVATLVGAGLPPPLAVWRDFEVLAMRVRSGGGGDCESMATVWRRAADEGYRWFAIQASLESSTCATMGNRLEEASRLTAGALRMARESSLRVALLRAQGFQASHLVNEGRYREAAQAGHDALVSIVNAGYPIRRAHEYYNVQIRWADHLEHNATARASAQMARLVAAACGFGLLEMIGAAKEATFAERMGARGEAERLFRMALGLCAELTPGPDAAAYKAFALAGLYETRGDTVGLNTLRAQTASLANVLYEAPIVHAIARSELGASQPGRAVATLAGLWRRLELSKGGRGMGLRRDAATTAALLARALLESGDHDGLRAVWRQFLLGEAAMLGAKAERGLPGRSWTIAPLDGRLAAWREGDSESNPAWLPKRAAEVSALARRLRRLCSSPATPLAAIQAATEALIADLRLSTEEGGARAGPLRLCARGDLNTLPLALLLADGRLAGQFDSGAYVPFPLRAGTSAGLEKKRVVVVDGTAVPAGWADQIPSLGDAASEVRETAAILGAGVLSGPAATTAALERILAATRLLHFTGHAVPWRDGVALLVTPDAADRRADARRGLWRIDPSHPLPGSLLVLSACSTAAGVGLRTVTPAHLAEAALLAGARTVVASLWDVDSGAAVRFNDEFYRRLAAGVRPARAALEAALAVRRIRGFEHPYYWAPFVVFESAESE